MCLKFLAGVVVLVVVARSSAYAHVRSPCINFDNWSDRSLISFIYNETVKMEGNIKDLHRRLTNESTVTTASIERLINLPWSTNLPECRELMGSVRTLLGHGIRGLQRLKEDLHVEHGLELYNYENEMSHLRDFVHCYLYRTSSDQTAFLVSGMPESAFTMPSYVNTDEMHFRNKHFANELIDFLQRTYAKVVHCFGSARDKRERATWLERALETRAREMLQSQLEQDAAELVSKRDRVPTWEDALGLDGAAYPAEAKRDTVDWYGLGDRVDGPAPQGWLGDAFTPEDAPREARYSHGDLERAFQLLYGPAEEPKKRSEYASSWMTYL